MIRDKKEDSLTWDERMFLKLLRQLSPAERMKIIEKMRERANEP